MDPIDNGDDAKKTTPPFLALNVHLVVGWAAPLAADGWSKHQGSISFALLLAVRPRFLQEWKGQKSGMDWWERAFDSIRGDRARRMPLKEEWARETAPSIWGDIPVFAIGGNCVGTGGRSFLSADAAREHTLSLEKWLREDFLAKLKRENIAFPWSQWTPTPPRRAVESWPGDAAIGVLCREFERESLLDGMAASPIEPVAGLAHAPRRL